MNIRGRQDVASFLSPIPIAGRIFFSEKRCEPLGPVDAHQDVGYSDDRRNDTMMKAISFLLLAALLSGCGKNSDDNSAALALLAMGGSAACSTAVANSSDNLSTTTVTGKYKVVDTNQTLCYNSTTSATEDCTGLGYDGSYPGNQPSYTNNGNGTVTDNVTGLMWTRSTDINNDGTVNYSDKMYQCEAESYCENLTAGGHSDWRLPDIKTLYSLIQFSGKDASTFLGTDTSGLTPFIDTTAFDRAFGDQDAGDRIIDAQYATSTIYVSTTMNGDTTMFGVNFVDGRIKGYPATKNKYYVRCVRGESDYGKNNFSITDNGTTVTDHATGLVWQQADYLSTDWQDAVDYCENLSLGMKTDWRLPNVKELQSIVDYSRSPDTTSSAALDAKFSATSFTSENGRTEWGYYWASTTHVDNDNDAQSATNATYVSFGRALGYMNGSMMDVHGAGAQRSNDKTNIATEEGASSANLGQGLFYYHGPQGDILRLNNRVRCVRAGN